MLTRDLQAGINIRNKCQQLAGLIHITHVYNSMSINDQLPSDALTE